MMMMMAMKFSGRVIKSKHEAYSVGALKLHSFISFRQFSVNEERKEKTNFVLSKRQIQAEVIIYIAEFLFLLPSG